MFLLYEYIACNSDYIVKIVELNSSLVCQNKVSNRQYLPFVSVYGIELITYSLKSNTLYVHFEYFLVAFVIFSAMANSTGVFPLENIS